MLFLSNPLTWSSVLSLEDRKVIIEAFDLGQWAENWSYGEKLVYSNQLIQNFNKKFSINFHPHKLATFFYDKNVIPCWQGIGADDKDSYLIGSNERLRRILESQREENRANWENIWAIAEPVIKTIKELLLSAKVVERDRIESLRKTLPPEFRKITDFGFGNWGDKEKQNKLLQNNDFRKILKDMELVQNPDALHEDLKRMLKQRGLGVTGLSIWVSYVRPDMFMPISKNVLGNVRQTLHLNRFWGSDSNITEFLTFSKGLKDTCEVAGITNMYEAAFYLMKYETGADTRATPAPERFHHLKRILESKKQLILYGPVGVGKTFTAKQFAVWFLQERYVEPKEEVGRSFEELQRRGQADLVQFHPAYSYEEFVEGIRPFPSNGGVDYRVRPGIFRRMCEMSDDGLSRILIIDEINRGNIPKIFGELLYALEYRDEPVKLQYSGADRDAKDNQRYLKVPSNLYIIGTMNTADRSIALLDTALRRRFNFEQLMPDYDFLATFLGCGPKFDEGELKRKYSEDNRREKRIVILSLLALKKLNEKISANKKLGMEKQIGHVLLMRLTDNPEKNFILVWRHDIIPLLEEYFYANYDELTRLFGDQIVSPTSGIKNFGIDELEEALKKLCEV